MCITGISPLLLLLDPAGVGKRWLCQHASEGMLDRSLPLQVGPIIGPVVGGGLSYALGWRSTFVALAILGALVFIALLVFLEVRASYPHTPTHPTHPPLPSSKG